MIWRWSLRSWKICSRCRSCKTWYLSWSTKILAMKNCLISWTRKWFTKTVLRSLRKSRRAQDTKWRLIWIHAQELSLRACLECATHTWRIALVLSSRWLWRRPVPPSCREWRKTTTLAKSSAKSSKSKWPHANSKRTHCRLHRRNTGTIT